MVSLKFAIWPKFTVTESLCRGWSGPNDDSESGRVALLFLLFWTNMGCRDQSVRVRQTQRRRS